jgi:hypothetical protein
MFGKLLKDLEGVRSTFDRLFGIATKKYPAFIGSTSYTQITNNPNYKNADWRSSRGYEFSVELVWKEDNAIDPVKPGGWSPFALQINPQELTQDEIFAIQVTPTFRGVVVEHQGVTIKDITISGTTGISPKRAEGGAVPDSGAPLFQVGTSGFEEFHELRSYFRMYVEAKRQEDKSLPYELRLVFSNVKDNEFLFVEPQKFSMKRNASKPFLYDYTISLKAIGVANVQKNVARGILDSIDDVLSKAQEYTQLAIGAINAGFAIISRFQRNLSSAVLDPLNNLNNAILAVRGGVASNFGEFGITRRFVKDLERVLKSIEENFSDIMGRDNDQYNAVVGRTPTLQGNPNRVSTYQELQILNGIQAGKKATSLLASQVELFEPNIFTTNAEVLASFPNSNISTPNSITTSTIGGGDNIQTLALRELGDIDKFKDIIILNNLKPPYISETGGPGILKPGDKILIPRNNPAGSSSVVKNVQYNITSKMQQAERDLGVDIRLTEDADLAIASNKDLDLVAGVDNLVQAILIKILIERGSLKRHPQIGTNLELGTKLRSKGLQALRREISDSLNSDNRVESVPFIRLNQEGGTITAEIFVKIKEIDQPVPLPLTLNVG